MRKGYKLLTYTLLFCLLLTIPLSTASALNPSTQEKLDQYIQDTLKKLKVPGASVAISKDSALVYSQTFGKGIEENTRFFIGSISKSFTALAIMQLVEQGKVDLDKSVSSYIKEFTVSDKITVGHLLQHTSGMTDLDYISTLPDEAEFFDLVLDMNGTPLRYQPGEQFAYFNPNYGLLGFIIEIASGQDYTSYMENNIIKPLGLTNTSMRGEVDTPGHASYFGFSIRRTEPFPKYDLPGGYITSTAEDMVKYLDAIRLRKPVLGVSPEGVAQIETGNPYGMGWFIGKVANRPAIFHGGSNRGYSSDSVMLVEDGYNIVILLNKNHMFNGIFFYPDLTRGIISILINQEPPIRVNYFWIFRLLIVPFFLTLILNLRKVVKLIRTPGEKTVQIRIKAAVLRSALSIAIITIIPIAVTAYMQRGFTWPLAFQLMPDMISWLFVGVGFGLVEAVIHLWLAFKGRFATETKNL